MLDASFCHSQVKICANSNLPGYSAVSLGIDGPSSQTTVPLLILPVSSSWAAMWRDIECTHTASPLCAAHRPTVRQVLCEKAGSRSCNTSAQ